MLWHKTEAISRAVSFREQTARQNRPKPDIRADLILSQTARPEHTENTDSIPMY